MSFIGKIALWIPGLRHQIKSFEMLREISGVLQDTRNEMAVLRSAQAIDSLEHQRATNPRFQDERRLLKAQFQVNSQNGEDGMIAEVFRRIGTTNHTFVELGLEDGRESNTAFLLARGWRGYWVDGSPQMQHTIASQPTWDAQRIQTRVAFVTAENVDSILADMGVPQEIDLLSIDIDQNTYHVWNALRAVSPRVMVVEYNASLPSDVDWKVQYDPNRVWDGTTNVGASLKALERLGDQRGYRLVGCDFTGTNAFFVRDDLVGNHFCEPFTSENHFEPSRYPMIHHRSHPRGLLDMPPETAADVSPSRPDSK